MNQRKLLIRLPLLFLIALSSVSFAFGQSSNHVKAKGYASVDGIRPGDKFKIAVALEIEEGYHITPHELPNAAGKEQVFSIPTAARFEPSAGIRILKEQYPPAQFRTFEFTPGSPQQLPVYEGTIYIIAEAEADQSIQPGAAAIRASVTVQACNNTQCFAPANLPIEIPLQIVPATQAVNEINRDIFNAALVEYKSDAQSNDIARLIASRGLIVALLFVFFSGLLLNATPCVYPIIPITIGFFMNQSASEEGKPRLQRTFAMASMYVLGMAVTYSLLGVVAAMSKGLFGAALQNPIVLINLAALMIALSLSMFGVYEFKVPEFLNRFATKSTQATSGIIGALVMGLTMGIVAAPCIGPFVLALLVFVGEKGDPLFGFLMFFVLALGLGLPYLILGTFSGAIKSLPRSGMWMVTVRKVFGLVLIGMALYFLTPLMGGDTTYIFVEFFALSAVYLIFFEAGRTKQKQFAWALRVIGIIAAAVAIWMAMPKRPEQSIAWQPYSEQALTQAVSQGKGIIIDAYADWCIPCKELDKATFTDDEVRKESERFVTLKLNLTNPEENSEAKRAQDRFAIKGVPTIIFLDGAGREVSRFTGFQDAEYMLAEMKKIESVPGAGAQALAQNAVSEGTAVSDVPAGVTAGGASADRLPAASSSEPVDSKNSELTVESKKDETPVALPNEVNEPLPAVTLNLLKGGTLAPASLRGKVVVLTFWATWCVPCVGEIPILNQLNRQYKSQGLEIIAISYPDEGPDKVKEFLKDHPMYYTQSLGSDAVSRALRLGENPPVTIVIDKKGRIRFRHNGAIKRKQIEAEISKLLGE
ncbi:MAG TPA: cytochrome c biogenesis protein CcdA [Blastocatellia bacterium]|nr:cytochrome c biogenesis protein CcdA [Blastocatellia bacterium]